MRWLLDTNAVINIQKGILVEPIPDIEALLSVISRIELLSYSKLAVDQKEMLADFLNSFEVIPLNQDVENKAIEMRSKYNLKIPDAIIAATSFVSNSVLITNDKKLKTIEEINVKSLEIRYD
ncbi:MAG: type II toxin-antitoxin system VapC family toxin [Leptospira sp.]|jgi:predicted nucleic acid-binding protein|nr:type II toxin-antitoxin system VapC family toxin [Leptospira sp.]